MEEGWIKVKNDSGHLESINEQKWGGNEEVWDDFILFFNTGAETDSVCRAGIGGR